MIYSNRNNARLQAFVAIAALLCLTTRDAQAYGPDGHHIVGAVADERLANTPTGKKIAVILDGMSLREASVIPDTIRQWDSKGVEDPKNAGYFSSRPRIAAQLREFWKANQPTHDANSPNPSHHWFHYTDVPVEAAKYSSGKTGRSQWDVVHMIPYCTAVLRGEVPEENPRKITKAVAIILLTHYVGDIHQPLHVGAQYFDQAGHQVNPDLGKPALEDQGGNTILLDISGGNSEKRPKFHSFWDGDPVKALLPGAQDEGKDVPKWQMSPAEKTLVQQFSTQEPKDWRLPANVALKDYAEAWADEILPIAREAHQRLTFQEMTTKQQGDGAPVATGVGREKPMPDKLTYRVWSANIVRIELPKAGWRLADLLDKALSSQAAPSGATPSGAAPGAAPPAPSETPAAPVESQPPIPSATPPPTATPDTGPYGAYPANYRDVVIGWLRVNLPDAASTIVHWQAEPKPTELQAAPGKTLTGYVVVFNTSKTVNGVKDPAVAPRQTRSVVIRDGQVIKADGF